MFWPKGPIEQITTKRTPNRPLFSNNSQHQTRKQLLSYNKEGGENQLQVIRTYRIQKSKKDRREVEKANQTIVEKKVKREETLKHSQHRG